MTTPVAIRGRNSFGLPVSVEARGSFLAILRNRARFIGFQIIKRGGARRVTRRAYIVRVTCQHVYPTYTTVSVKSKFPNGLIKLDEHPREFPKLGRRV